MTEQIIYQCRECSRHFRSTDADVSSTVQSYCPGCGKVCGQGRTEIPSSGDGPQKTGGAECAACGSSLKKKNVVVCPRCKSPNVEVRGSVNILK